MSFGLPVGNGLYAYFSVAVAIGIIVVWAAGRAISRAERRRRDQYFEQRRFEALNALPADSNPKLSQDVRSIEAIAKRFVRLRRLALPLLMLAWTLLAMIPLLESASGTVVSFVLGVGTLFIGMTVKPFFDNFIAGLVIRRGHPLAIGDTVTIDGEYGTIEDVTATSTIVKSWDWRRIVIPNSTFLQKQFVNFTLFDRYHWAHVEFWVEPTADLAIVERAAIAAVTTAKGFVPYETPSFWVMEMGKDGIRCWVAGWADNPSDSWALTHDTRTALVKALRLEGIRCHCQYRDTRVETLAPPLG